MKTIFVPKGETVTYETLNTDVIIVHGCLEVTEDIHAAHITGKGVVHGGNIFADTITVRDLECATVTCEKLVAKRVTAAEVVASDEICVSCYLLASSVTTGFLTVAKSQIHRVMADEVINLQPKLGGLWWLMVRSYFQSLLLPMMIPADAIDAEYEPLDNIPPDDTTTANPHKEIQAVVAQNVCNMMEKKDEDDFELKRFTAMFKLFRNHGFTLKIIPNTPEENAPTDFRQAA